MTTVEQKSDGSVGILLEKIIQVNGECKPPTRLC